MSRGPSPAYVLGQGGRWSSAPNGTDRAKLKARRARQVGQRVEEGATATTTAERGPAVYFQVWAPLAVLYQAKRSSSCPLRESLRVLGALLR